MESEHEAPETKRMVWGISEGGHELPNPKRMVWGFFLIALGGAFLLERFGLIHADIGRLWPTVFYAIAVIHLMQRRPGSAVMVILMGTWFLACTFGWWDLSFHNSWGLILVAVGAGMVVGALSGEDKRTRERMIAGIARSRARRADAALGEQRHD